MTRDFSDPRAGFDVSSLFTVLCDTALLCKKNSLSHKSGTEWGKLKGFLPNTLLRSSVTSQWDDYAELHVLKRTLSEKMDYLFLPGGFISRQETDTC